jgi:hypothetical protein
VEPGFITGKEAVIEKGDIVVPRGVLTMQIEAAMSNERISKTIVGI